MKKRKRMEDIFVILQLYFWFFFLFLNIFINFAGKILIYIIVLLWKRLR